MPFQSVCKPFYFIRHGESVANSQQIMCGGNVDTPLTDKGRQQAALAAEIMAGVSPKPTVIIHSDLSRARETAQIVNRFLNLPMIETNTLREHKVGAWEGLTWEETIDDWNNEVDPPEGETFPEFINRATQAVSQVLGQYEMPLIVAHGGVWQSLPRLYDLRFDESTENAIPYFFEPIVEGIIPSHNTLFPWNAHVLDVCTVEKKTFSKRQSGIIHDPHPIKRQPLLKAAS